MQTQVRKILCLCLIVCIIIGISKNPVFADTALTDLWKQTVPAFGAVIDTWLPWKKDETS